MHFLSLWQSAAGSVIETASLTKHLNTERLESVAGHFQPIVLMSRQDQSQSISLAKSTLIDLFGIIDLLEPFDRIKTALVALAKVILNIVSCDGSTSCFS